MKMITLSSEVPIPVIRAVFTSDHDDLKEHLDNNNNHINTKDAIGGTALHCAAYRSDETAVHTLLNAGARVNAKDNNWRTPLHRVCATTAPVTNAVALLIGNGADVNAKDRDYSTPMHVVATYNAVGHARYLVDYGANIDCTDNCGRSPLHHAVYNGHVEISRFLLEHGCSVNLVDNELGYRPIHWATYLGILELVELLTEYACDLSVTDNNLNTTLHTAAASGQIEIVNLLLDSGVPVHSMNSMRNTPLHIAALNGHEMVIQALLSRGALTNGRNKKGQTPLHLAALTSDGDRGGPCLQLLLKSGANANLKGSDGRTALHFASIHGRFHRADVLLSYGALVNASDRHGFTPLHFAAKFGHEMLLETLLSQNADPYKIGPDGMLPLHMAAHEGYVTTCERLVEHCLQNSNAGAKYNPDTADGKGRTVLHHAACKGRVDCVDSFIALGSHPDMLDAENRTALHYACLNNHIDCCLSLIAAGATVNLRDSRGCTALHYAAYCDTDGELINRLLKVDPNAVNIRDSAGYSVAHYCLLCENADTRSLELILSSASQNLLLPPESSDHSSLASPLHIAARTGDNLVLTKVMNLLTNQVKCGDYIQRSLFDQFDQTAVDIAAYLGHAYCVETLLGGLPYQNKETVSRSAMLLASRNGHCSVLRSVVEYNEKTNVTKAKRLVDDYSDYGGITPLMKAASHGFIQCISCLVQRGANALTQDPNRHTASDRAVIHGQLPCYQLLAHFIHSSQQQASYPCDRSPLHLAAMGGQAKIIQHLIKAELMSKRSNSDQLHEFVHKEDADGFTPLHYACYQGEVECVSALLRSSSIRGVAGNAFSPIHCASVNGNADCITAIESSLVESIPIEQLANFPDGNGRTPLMAAAYADHCDTMQLLIDLGASLDSADMSGRTALMFSAANGHPNSVALLLDSGADVSQYDANHNTPLLYAVVNQNEPTALLLTERLSDSHLYLINQPNKDGKSPLHLASEYGMVSLVDLLLSMNADSFAQDSQGNIPILSCARDEQVAECMKLLLAHMASGWLSKSRSPFGNTKDVNIPKESSDIPDSATNSYQSSDSEFF